MAYAYSPGLVHTSTSDDLLTTAAGYMTQGPALTKVYPRFNLFGLALRPLLKEALADPRPTLESFLPRATGAWLVLVELEKARNTKPTAQMAARDYRKDPRHSIFIFGPGQDQVPR